MGNYMRDRLFEAIIIVIVVFVVFAILFSFLGFGDVGCGYGMWGMMGGGFMGFGWLIMLFPIIFILILVFALFEYFADKKAYHEEKSHIEILNQRYARGEISREEYLRMKKDLERR